MKRDLCAGPRGQGGKILRVPLGSRRRFRREADLFDRFRGLGFGLRDLSTTFWWPLCASAKTATFGNAGSSCRSSARSTSRTARGHPRPSAARRSRCARQPRSESGGRASCSRQASPRTSTPGGTSRSPSRANGPTNASARLLRKVEQKVPSLSLSLSLRPRHHHPSVRAIERVLCVSPTGDKEERSQKQDCVKKKNRGANSHMKTFEYRDEIEKEEAKRDKLEAKRARASSAANAETNDAPAAEEREPKTTADAAAANERGDSDAADSQADAQLAQDAQTAAKGRRAASLKRLAGSRKQRAEDAARALKRAVDESTTLPESVSKHSLSLSPFFPMEDAKKNAVDGRRAPSAKKRHPSSRAGAPQPRPRSSMRGYADKTPRSTPTPTPRSPTNSSRRPRPSPTTHSRPTTPQEERTRIRERTPPPAQASSD